MKLGNQHVYKTKTGGMCHINKTAFLSCMILYSEEIAGITCMYCIPYKVQTSHLPGKPIKTIATFWRFNFVSSHTTYTLFFAAISIITHLIFNKVIGGLFLQSAWYTVANWTGKLFACRNVISNYAHSLEKKEFQKHSKVIGAELCLFSSVKISVAGFPCVRLLSTHTKLEFARLHGSALADWPGGGNLIYELPASDSRAWPLGGAVDSTFWHQGEDSLARAVAERLRMKAKRALVESYNTGGSSWIKRLK